MGPPQRAADSSLAAHAAAPRGYPMPEAACRASACRCQQQTRKARRYPQWPASLQYAHIQGVKAPHPAADRAPALFLVHSQQAGPGHPLGAHPQLLLNVRNSCGRSRSTADVGDEAGLPQADQAVRGYCDGPALQQPRRGTVVTQIVTQTINGQLRGCPELAADLVVLWSG